MNDAPVQREVFGFTSENIASQERKANFVAGRVDDHVCFVDRTVGKLNLAAIEGLDGAARLHATVGERGDETIRKSRALTPGRELGIGKVPVVRIADFFLNPGQRVPALDRFVIRLLIGRHENAACFSYARRLTYRLKTRWRDGTTHILMERHELLERLAPLIPPPRAHQVRYHGILAPCASGRDRVVPAARRVVIATSADKEGRQKAECPTRRTQACRPPAEVKISTAVNAGLQQGSSTPPDGSIADCDRGSRAAQAAPSSQGPAPTQPLRPHRVLFSRARRLPWADLLKRVFGVDALRCQCGNSMRVLAAITDPAVARRVLICMALPARAPPLNPARAPSSAPASWLEAPAAEDFDQTPPGDWEPCA